MINLTTSLPTIMFRVDYDGIRSEAVFYLGKEMVYERYVLPTFPSKVKFKHGVKAYNSFLARNAKERFNMEKSREKLEAKNIEAAERVQLKSLKKFGSN